MLEIVKKPKVTVKLYDVVYELDRPTVGMQEAHEEAMGSGKSNWKTLREYAVSLGLPADVCKKMEVEDFLNLFEYMMPKKKD